MDKEYIPVPLREVEATPNMDMLVVDSTKVAMDDALEGGKNQIFTPEQYAKASKKVDDY